MPKKPETPVTADTTTVLDTQSATVDAPPETNQNGTVESTTMSAQVSAFMETLKASGLDAKAIADMGLAETFQTALASTEERWNVVRDTLLAKLPDLVGDFDSFQAIEITRTPDGFKVERKLKNSKGNGGNGGGRGTRKPCTVHPSHQQQYGVSGYYPSVRQLSHALAKALGETAPPDNGTGRYVRKNAPDLADALLADGHTLT